MGAGKGTGSSQGTSSFSPPSWMLQAGQAAVNQALPLSRAPFPIPQQPIAGINPFQVQAMENTAGIAGTGPGDNMAQPFIDTGAAMETQGWQPFAGAASQFAGSGWQPAANASSQLAAQGSQPDIGKYFGAEAAGVVPQLENIFGQQTAQQLGNLTQQAGGPTADRIGVGLANLANQQGLAAGQTLSGLMGQSVGQALQGGQLQEQAAGQMGNLAQLPLQAAGQMGNLAQLPIQAGAQVAQMGPQSQQSALQAQQAMLGAGSMQQQQLQNQINSAYENVLQQISWPYQTTSYLGSMAAGLAPGMGGMGITSGNTKNSMLNTGGLGSGLGAGLAQKMGAASGGRINDEMAAGGAVNYNPFAKGGRAQQQWSDFDLSNANDEQRASLRSNILPRILPALKLKDGKVLVGKRGQWHHDVGATNGIDVPLYRRGKDVESTGPYQRGFVDPQDRRFYDAYDLGVDAHELTPPHQSMTQQFHGGEDHTNWGTGYGPGGAAKGWDLDDNENYSFKPQAAATPFTPSVAARALRGEPSQRSNVPVYKPIVTHPQSQLPMHAQAAEPRMFSPAAEQAIPSNASSVTTPLSRQYTIPSKVITPFSRQGTDQPRLFSHLPKQGKHDKEWHDATNEEEFADNGWNDLPEGMFERILPTIFDTTKGKYLIGKRGETHSNVAENHGIDIPYHRGSSEHADRIYQRGFVDPLNHRFYHADKLPVDSTDLSPEREHHGSYAGGGWVERGMNDIGSPQELKAITGRIMPAIRMLGDQQVHVGKRGQWHNQIAENLGIRPSDTDAHFSHGNATYERGFVDPQTKSYYRALSLGLDASQLQPYDPIREMHQGQHFDQGGFTVNEMGETPPHGYMVSLPGHEQVLGKSSTTPQDRAAYTQHNAGLLHEPGNYFGGWQDKGKTYFDVSRNVPTRTEAMRQAHRGHQKAIFDLAHHQTIPARAAGGNPFQNGGAAHGEGLADPGKGVPSAGFNSLGGAGAALGPLSSLGRMIAGAVPAMADGGEVPEGAPQQGSGSITANIPLEGLANILSSARKQAPHQYSGPQISPNIVGGQDGVATPFQMSPTTSWPPQGWANAEIPGIGQVQAERAQDIAAGKAAQPMSSGKGKSSGGRVGYGTHELSGLLDTLYGAQRKYLAEGGSADSDDQPEWKPADPHKKQGDRQKPLAANETAGSPAGYGRSFGTPDIKGQPSPAMQKVMGYKPPDSPNPMSDFGGIGGGTGGSQSSQSSSRGQSQSSQSGGIGSDAPDQSASPFDTGVPAVPYLGTAHGGRTHMAGGGGGAGGAGGSGDGQGLSGLGGLGLMSGLFSEPTGSLGAPFDAINSNFDNAIGQHGWITPYAPANVPAPTMPTIQRPAPWKWPSMPAMPSPGGPQAQTGGFGHANPVLSLPGPGGDQPGGSAGPGSTSPFGLFGFDVGLPSMPGVETPNTPSPTPSVSPTSTPFSTPNTPSVNPVSTPEDTTNPDAAEMAAANQQAIAEGFMNPDGTPGKGVTTTTENLAPTTSTPTTPSIAEAAAAAAAAALGNQNNSVFGAPNFGSNFGTLGAPTTGAVSPGPSPGPVGAMGAPPGTPSMGFGFAPGFGANTAGHSNGFGTIGAPGAGINGFGQNAGAIGTIGSAAQAAHAAANQLGHQGFTPISLNPSDPMGFPTAPNTAPVSPDPGVFGLPGIVGVENGTPSLGLSPNAGFSDAVAAAMGYGSGYSDSGFGANGNAGDSGIGFGAGDAGFGFGADSGIGFGAGDAGFGLSPNAGFSDAVAASEAGGYSDSGFGANGNAGDSGIGFGAGDAAGAASGDSGIGFGAGDAAGAASEAGGYSDSGFGANGNAGDSGIGFGAGDAGFGGDGGEGEGGVGEGGDGGEGGGDAATGGRRWKTPFAVGGATHMDVGGDPDQQHPSLMGATGLPGTSQENMPSLAQTGYYGMADKMFQPQQGANPASALGMAGATEPQQQPAPQTPFSGQQQAQPQQAPRPQAPLPSQPAFASMTPFSSAQAPQAPPTDPRMSQIPVQTSTGDIAYASKSDLTKVNPQDAAHQSAIEKVYKSAGLTSPAQDREQASKLKGDAAIRPDSPTFGERFQGWPQGPRQEPQQPPQSRIPEQPQPPKKPGAELLPTAPASNPQATPLPAYRMPGSVDRSWAAPQLQQNPGLVARMAAMVKGEVGFKDPKLSMIQLETVFNRAKSRGITLEEALKSVADDPKKGYYARDTYSRPVSPLEMQIFKNNILPRVLNGSDEGTKRFGFMPTGNASGDFALQRQRAGNKFYANSGWYSGQPGQGEMYATEIADARPGIGHNSGAVQQVADRMPVGRQHLQGGPDVYTEHTRSGDWPIGGAGPYFTDKDKTAQFLMTMFTNNPMAYLQYKNAMMDYADRTRTKEQGQKDLQAGSPTGAALAEEAPERLKSWQNASPETDGNAAAAGTAHQQTAPTHQQAAPTASVAPKGTNAAPMRQQPAPQQQQPQQQQPQQQQPQQQQPQSGFGAGPATAGIQNTINDHRMDAQNYRLYAGAIEAGLATGNYDRVQKAQQAMELSRSRRVAMMQQMAGTALTEQQQQMVGVRQTFIPQTQEFVVMDLLHPNSSVRIPLESIPNGQPESLPPGRSPTGEPSPVVPPQGGQPQPSQPNAHQPNAHGPDAIQQGLNATQKPAASQAAPTYGPTSVFNYPPLVNDVPPMNYQGIINDNLRKRFDPGAIERSNDDMKIAKHNNDTMRVLDQAATRLDRAHMEAAKTGPFAPGEGMGWRRGVAETIGSYARVLGDVPGVEKLNSLAEKLLNPSAEVGLAQLDVMTRELGSLLAKSSTATTMGRVNPLAMDALGGSLISAETTPAATARRIGGIHAMSRWAQDYFHELDLLHRHAPANTPHDGFDEEFEKTHPMENYEDAGRLSGAVDGKYNHLTPQLLAHAYHYGSPEEIQELIRNFNLEGTGVIEKMIPHYKPPTKAEKHENKANASDDEGSYSFLKPLQQNEIRQQAARDEYEQRAKKHAGH